MNQHRLWIYLVLLVIVILVPGVAMLLTDEVNWTLGDFMAAILLISSGILVYEIGRIIIVSKKARVVLVVAITIVLLLIWAELAVGILDSLFQVRKPNQ